MSFTKCPERAATSERIPDELIELRERIQAQPPSIRAELEPLVEGALEDALFRGRAMMIARDALLQYRLDLASLSFDLEVTRRERAALIDRLAR
jgi:hypothetical protein